ncbi:MAG: TetR/AcrR family transcriptional regulator [Gammaproteobacteria bacterium]|nr:TetR/AcrR family transcriptional regulator [Gammaproteobacteria bacterium]
MVSPAKPRSGPGRPRSARAHQAMLAAALELLARDGYGELTLTAVARHAGVGRGSVYRRWRSKVALVVDAFQELPQLPTPDTGNLVDDLTEEVQGLLRIFGDSPLGHVLPILAAECTRDPALREELAPVFRIRRAPLLGVLERAVARNELPPDLDIEAAADLLVGPIVNRLFFTGAMPDPASARRYVDAALYGINRLRV